MKENKMNLPETIYVIIDKDENGIEYPVAHEKIEEIMSPNNEIVGIYELKEMALLHKGIKNERME